MRISGESPEARAQMKLGRVVERLCLQKPEPFGTRDFLLKVRGLRTPQLGAPCAPMVPTHLEVLLQVSRSRGGPARTGLGVIVEGQGRPALQQGLVAPHQVLAQRRAGQQGQPGRPLPVVRQWVWAGPAPGQITGKWVGHELEAPGLTPSTS